MSLFDIVYRLLRVWNGLLSLALCCAFCTVLLSFNSSQKQVFHDVAITTFLYPAQFVLTRVNRTLSVFSENRELKSENTRLRVQNDVLQQSLKLAPRLEEMMEYKAQSEYTLRFGQIIGQDPGRLGSSWLVNLGTSDSVEVNMPVLTTRGIVGKVAKSFHQQCLVQLLNDPDSKVSVIGNRSRALGLLEAWRPGKLIVRFPANSDIITGDTVVTSGLGGVFPKGLSVGIIDDKELESSDIIKGFSIKLFERPQRVEEVFVLIQKPSWQAKTKL